MSTSPHPQPKPNWLEAARSRATPAELRLWQALEEVEDPEWPVSVVDMGLIYDLSLHQGCASIRLTFTAMGCPCMEFIIGDIRERLLQEETVQQVEIEIVWDPPWTRQRLTERGREKLRTCGIAA